ncbi:hypothetical protein [Caminicella sporogenes]|uniref:hypothetical protein n=1 Tax=Caminicella sporogenes TaxID=166485 RepID=UPI0025419780|nr:hypothetical protein [Caminicella sporogenes]WIF95216.1 hypothetical protein QNI18_00840 [Caminicella sporogenes]
MYKKLTEKFFDDNLDNGINAQKLFYIQLDIPQISKIAEDIVKQMTNRARKEAEMIEKENNPNEETGYGVIKIKTKEHKELFTIKGKFKKSST